MTNLKYPLTNALKNSYQDLQNRLAIEPFHCGLGKVQRGVFVNDSMEDCSSRLCKVKSTGPVKTQSVVQLDLPL